MLAMAMASESTIEEINKDKSKKPLVGDYPLTGLALAWDNLPQVRTRMRAGYNLLTHFDCKLKKESNHAIEKTTKDLKVNYHALMPVCSLIRNHGLLPNVDRLAEEIVRLHELSSTVCDNAQKQAWAIRHLLSVLKNNVRVDKKTLKKKIPQDHGYTFFEIIRQN